MNKFQVLFQEFYNEKKELNVLKVDKNSRYYELIMKEMRFFIKSFIGSPDFEIKPSVVLVNILKFHGFVFYRKIKELVQVLKKEYI